MASAAVAEHCEPKRKFLGLAPNQEYHLDLMATAFKNQFTFWIESLGYCCQTEVFSFGDWMKLTYYSGTND